VAQFLVMKAVAGKNFCILRTLKNAPDANFVRKGVAVASWPDNVQYWMDPSFPKQVQLSDSVSNDDEALVISSKLKELIEGLKPSNLEFLPLTIIDHKGKVASSEYFIANCTHLQDCIDQKASDLVWNRIDPTLIASVKKLVVDESKIPPETLVFRMKHFPKSIIVSRALSEAISGKGFSGILFRELDTIR